MTQGYRYQDAALNDSHNYLLPAVLTELTKLHLSDDEKRVFDLGCGNGSIAAQLSSRGYKVTGVDPAEEGITQANQEHPEIELHSGSAYEPLAERFGRFPVVISLEVVEHVYYPRKWARTLYDLIADGGTAIISTPYHGYLKNLVLAVTGKLDAHFTALWDDGHIKFWSFKTIGNLLREQGFRHLRFERVGRIAPLAKSMVVIAQR